MKRLKELSFLFFLIITACTQKPSERCQPATIKQLDFISYAVQTNTKSNYIENGYSIKSNDFKNVHMVAVMLYGPSMEEGVGPAVFAVGGDPDQPHTWLAVDGFAKEFTDLPDASTTDAEITLSADGVDEVKSCYK
jgi:hypothetical protein